MKKKPASEAPFQQDRDWKNQFHQSHIIFFFKQQYFRKKDKTIEDATALHYKTESHE